MKINDNIKINDNMTITDVPGFLASGIHGGIRKSGKKDLSVIYSQHKAIAAGTFTKNIVKAAPVQLSMTSIKNANTQAIVVNSGNANACTGEEGLENANAIADKAAGILGLNSEEVLVSSTGIIGVQLPIDTILENIQPACDALSETGGPSASEAIMTTDTFTKHGGITFELNDTTVSIGAIAKGSGMIHPNMGTMLSFITTDISIDKALLQEMLIEDVNDTYNMVSVDGDTSTNDMVVVMANGLANNAHIATKDASYYKFKEALSQLNQYLAKKIAQDGEGATKLIEVNLKNAKSMEDAKKCAKAVVSSSLVKSAFFGNDANWGRIICSLGYAQSDFDPDKVTVQLKNSKDQVKIVEGGTGVEFCEDTALEILKSEHVKIDIDLKDGIYSTTSWGCDLSYDYIKINGCYTT